MLHGRWGSLVSWARTVVAGGDGFNMSRILVAATVRRLLLATTIVVASLVLITAGYLIEAPNTRPRLTAIFLVECGIAGLIAAIAEFGLLARLAAEMRLEVRALLEKVRLDYGVVAHTLKQGLTDVLPPRRDQRLGDAPTCDQIAAEIRDARGEVLVFGISLKDFLDGTSSINRVVQKLLIDDEKVKVKLLLIDPFSEAARTRARLEQGAVVSYEEGQLFSDLKASVSSLRFFVNRARVKSNFELDGRFYNVLPPVYSIVTPTVAFAEIYHFGRIETDGPCVGGFVPMMRFESSSQMYKRLVSHFWYVWQSTPGLQQVNTAAIESDGEYLQVHTLEEIESMLRAKTAGLPEPVFH
jgi:hypothetical protein